MRSNGARTGPRSGPNYWSRRLTQEHRLIYPVEGDRIVFLQARYHYRQ